MKELICIHYGHDTFMKTKVSPIVNQMFIKPLGGLWTSPVDSVFGWKDWCQSEEYDGLAGGQMYVQLKRTAKIYIIDSLEDLKKIPIQKELRLYGTVFPDFEWIAKQYDAIWLTNKGERETRYTRPHNLYGWDCETVLIMNGGCCYQVEYENVNKA